MTRKKMSEIQVSELLINAIKNKKVNVLRELFETIPTIDIAEILDDVEDISLLLYPFRVISSEYTGELFAELSTEQQEKIINAFSDKDLIKLLEESYADDIVDSLQDLPANIVSRVLRVAPSDLRKDINQLLNYAENTAGSIMTTEFLEMKNTVTVKEAIELIREKGKDAETVYTIFVRDSKRNFVGTVNLDDLIFAKDNETLEDIMDRDFVSCHVNDDQEDVANMFKRYDLTAMAVLNKEDKIVGIITIDDVVDIIVEEANEDVAALSHVAPLEDSYLDTPAWKMAVKCIPWIVILIILGTFTTMALDRIEKTAVFTFVPVLISFVPTLMDTGGNTGGQTIALMIRGLGTKEFSPKDFWKILGKEALTACIVSSCVALFGFLWFTVEQYTGIVTNEALFLEDGTARTIWNGMCWTGDFAKHTFAISGTVALTLFCGSFLAKCVAVMLPLGVAAIKKDPAIVAQPILTTIVDVVSLVVYLLIAMGAAKIFGLY